MVCSRGRSGVDGEAVPARTLPAARRGDGVYVPAGTDGARTRQRRRRPAVHHTVVRPRQQPRNHRQDRQVGLPFVLSTSVIGRQQCQMAGKVTVGLASFFRLLFQPVSRRISQSFHSFEERAAVCACLYMPGCLHSQTLADYLMFFRQNKMSMRHIKRSIKREHQLTQTAV